MSKLIDTHLLIPKGLYFLCSCFMYAPVLFQARYLDETWKIPVEKYGYMNLVTVFSIVASLIWSGFADRYRAHKQVLILKSLMYGVSYCCMWFLEPFMQTWDLDRKMFVISSIFLITAIFYSSIFPLLGTLVFSILESSESLRNGPIPPKRLLGRQKLFGTLGVGFVYALNGTLTDFIGYRAQFLIVSVSCVAFSLIAFFFLETIDSGSKPTLKPIESTESTESENIRDSDKVISIGTGSANQPLTWTENVTKLLLNWEFVNLLTIVFIIGISGNVFNVYYSIFMGKIMKGAKWKNFLMGSMTTIRLLVEIPIYLCGDVLIGRFGSYGVLLMGMLGSMLRPFGYALFVKDETSAKFGYFLELFKGFSHACNGLGGCVLASDLAPTGAQGTAQALFTSAHYHAASTISGLLCTHFLKMKNESTADDTLKIAIYRELFFWTGVLGLFGAFLNIYRLFKHKQDSIKK